MNARTGGDVVIVAAAFGMVTATGLTADTVPGIVWGFVGTIFLACAALVAWDILCDLAEPPTARQAEQDRREASRGWTPQDAREYRHERRADLWADDPDRTTRRQTWEG